MVKLEIGDYSTDAEILEDPSVRYWVKEQYRRSFDHDLLDAMRDAELLLKMLEARWKQEVG